MIRLVVVCFGVGIALVSAGCRRGASPVPRVAAAGHAATGAAPGLATPAGLPRDLPIYPGAVTLEATEAHGKGTSMVLECRETPQKVAAFYKHRLLEGGWSLDGEMTVEGEYMLVATKQARRASALVADEAGRTRITLTVTRGD